MMVLLLFKKKKRGNSVFVPKTFLPNNSNNQHGRLLTGTTLTIANTISQNADIICKPQTCESSPKFPKKIFSKIPQENLLKDWGGL